MARKNIKRPRLNSRKKRRNRYFKEEEERRQAAISFYDGVIKRTEEMAEMLEAVASTNPGAASVNFFTKGND